MRRFWIAVYIITAAGHAPFAVGLAFALGRIGAPLPWLLGPLAAAGTALGIRGRIARARRDAPISRARLVLIEEPFYVHWCAAVASAPPFAIAALALVVRWALGG